jgi:hypothetical protein
LSLVVINRQFLVCPARSLVIIPTDLFWLILIIASFGFIITPLGKHNLQLTLIQGCTCSQQVLHFCGIKHYLLQFSLTFHIFAYSITNECHHRLFLLTAVDPITAIRGHSVMVIILRHTFLTSTICNPNTLQQKQSNASKSIHWYGGRSMN